MFDGLHVHEYGQFSTSGKSLQQPLFLADNPNIDSSLNLSTMATSSVPEVAIEKRYNYSKACCCEKWIYK